jgi:periplasmic protein TonB
MDNFTKWLRAGWSSLSLCLSLGLFLGLFISADTACYAQKDVVGQWEAQITLRLADQRRFPPDARGQNGAAKVAFAIDRSGKVISETLIESTGSPQLDAEAIAMVKRAQPFPPPPAEVRDDTLKFELPVVFISPRPGPIIGAAAPKEEDDAVNAKIHGICRGC